MGETTISLQKNHRETSPQGLEILAMEDWVKLRGWTSFNQEREDMIVLE
jgi:hypothetical protein